MQNDFLSILQLMVNSASVGVIAWDKIESAAPIFQAMLAERRIKATPQEWDAVLADANLSRDKDAAAIDQARLDEAKDVTPNE